MKAISAQVYKKIAHYSEDKNTAVITVKIKLQFTSCIGFLQMLPW